uniref:ATP synthase F0 subunit 8 n=1 Tax=Apachyus feae TaxID=2914707 RepID=UPI001EF9DAF7|nr:ATP synthase F0 subunit 8 [Apachyus feae]UKE80564.1 ATP synthase F0 subunit 8 [Apachyus feae]
MPQMAPLSWSVLFMFFVVVYGLFTVVTFYYSDVSNESVAMGGLDQEGSLSWKW